ncbi:MAG: AzlD domain-containing protein [Lachnospiraceae bacterium]|nr:AzlD domain-containing protein [Lachnospiraceae bacterium]
MNKLHDILLVATVSGVTILLRFLPFWIFGGNRKTPKVITYLGEVLPYAIMGMLVVYCLRGISFFLTPFGIPEFLAVALVVILHWWKRNTLLSILGGTLFYMFLVQVVF